MKLLVVSPHPDDETLGAGGTILKYKEHDAKIYWLNFTDVKQEYGFQDEIIRKREIEINKVKAAYDFDGFYNFKLEPSGMDKYSKNELVKKVSEVFNEVKPNIVILPFHNDIHSDHRIIFEVVYSCTKSFRYPTIKKLLMSEILSETDFAISTKGFVPNYFIDITDYINKKIEIMSIYESELKTPPFPRSKRNILALASNRGSIAGCMYAESFILLKGIE